jgi:hypothetical protein
MNFGNDAIKMISENKIILDPLERPIPTESNIGTKKKDLIKISLSS